MPCQHQLLARHHIIPTTRICIFLCLAYLLGTVFHVKTMIRERTKPPTGAGRSATASPRSPSRSGTAPWTAALFGWLPVRATLLPGRGWSPKGRPREIANRVLLACAVLL
jgi:hypothetical protein